MMYHTSFDAHSGSVIIRAANGLDRPALRRIAERDSQAVPDGELLIVEVDGEAQAAIAIGTGEVIADPFRPTAELVRMLGLRRAELSGERRSLGRAEPSPALSARPC
jgi:hypothetical protein